MELSPEDSLRLNVLLANAAAIRIDEGALLVRGLSADGAETEIRLNPTGRADQYVRRVRELLSTVVLGSPGGYPVFIKRWTRMGQITGARLADLLKLGEPEAVVAVACAPDLTDELAERAWWAMPDSANARRMLARPAVTRGRMGPVLAAFLVEFLPFEEDPRAVVDSVRLILQPGLIDEATRAEIWQRGRHKPQFRIGFLQALPDDLPEQPAPHPGLEAARGALEALGDNPWARQLARLLGAPGQAWLETFAAALRKPGNQEATVALMEALADYFAPARVADGTFREPAELAELVAGLLAPGGAPPALAAAIEGLPGLERELRAMLYLAHAGEPLLRPIFSRTDAVGTVLRRRLEPVSGPLLEQVGILRGRG